MIDREHTVNGDDRSTLDIDPPEAGAATPRSTEDGTGRGPAPGVTGERSTRTAVTATDAEPVLTFRHVERGTVIGRYVVVDLVGKGGMGEIYRAFDPELDRAVALKLLPIAAGGEPGAHDTHRQRLLREAQALARLAHPNVVTVHDVGTYDDGVFIAMEFVPGRTLKAFLDEPDHARAEILDVLAAAGRGLAAAHAVGIVHRDFKPANVILGDDGRVRVIDFGVARAARGDAPTPPPWDPLGSDDGATPSASSLLSSPITQAGAVVGTPLYMAPEQARGRAVDERSDQFSFCVVLFEALYGNRPFHGRTRPELLRSILAGDVDRRPDADVPAWLERVIRRGLAADPAERWPSMAALLEALGADPDAAAARRRLRWLGLGGGAAAAAATAVAAWALLRAPAAGPPPCGGGEARLAGVWDVDVARRVRDRFTATGRPYASDIYRRTADALDGYARRWLDVRKDACEATRVRGDQSAVLLDLRMQCLERRRGELRALTSLYADGADGDVLDRAVQAAEGLEAPATCSAERVLSTKLPPPRDAATAAKVDALRDRLARARALESAGKYKVALDEVHAIRAEAHALGYLPLEAEAARRASHAAELAAAYPDAIAAAEDAITLAHQLGWEALAGESYVDLMYVLGSDQSRFDEALVYGRIADAILTHLGDDGDDRAALDHELGLVYWTKGDYAQARTRLEAAYQRALRLGGPDAIEVANVLSDLGITYDEQGDFDRARDAYERSRAIFEHQLGPDHPALGTAWLNLGVSAYMREDYPHAREAWQRALAIWEHSRGPDDPSVALVLNDLAELDGQGGDHARAADEYARALAIREKVLGPDDPMLVFSLAGLGNALLDQGRPRDAVPHFERVLRLCAHDRCTGEIAHTLGPTRFGLARALWDTGGDRARARALATEAIDAYRTDPAPQAKQAIAECQAWLDAHH